MSSHNYEVLRVRFIKARKYSSSLARFRDGDTENTTLMCLGHFDFIEIKRFESKENPLKIIEADQSEKDDTASNNSLIYPHYLIKKPNTQSKSNFWEGDLHFLSFIRIHCKKQGELNSLLSEKLEEELAGRITIQRKIELQINNEEKIITVYTGNGKYLVYYRIYDSLELGDAVAVLRSESLYAILQTIIEIRGLNRVRSTYSYHGVAARALRLVNTLSEEKIFAATRFSLNEASTAECKNQDGGSATSGADKKEPSKNIKSASQAITDLLKDINKTDCLNYITGATDYLLNWGSISEKQLFGIIFQRMHNEDSGLHEVLHESITRIGCSIGTLPAQKAAGQSNTLKKTKEHLESIEKHFNSRKDAQNVYSRTWLVSLSRLIDSLKTMARSPYTDELCLLLEPGVEALLAQIAHRLTREPTWNPALDENINAFISSCVALSNEIASIDSHLHQRPELTPVYYYVPAMLLRFAQVFTRRCCDVFKECDAYKEHEDEKTEKGPTFKPLVKTSQQRNVGTVCPIETVTRDDILDCPIQIDLPVNALFQPWDAAITLGHEAAHYSGISIRQRQKRCKCLAACAANYICREWMLDLVSSKEALEKLKASSELGNLIKKTVDKYSKILHEKAASDLHLRNVTDALSLTAGHIYSSQENFEEYYDNFILLDDKDAPLKRIEKLLYFEQQPKVNDKIISRHISEILRYYCYECYADIAVIILLNCSFSEYCKGIFHQEFEWISKRLSGVNFERTVEKWELKKYCDRIAFVIAAVASTNITGWRIEEIKLELDRQKDQGAANNSFERWVIKTAVEQAETADDWGKTKNYALYREEVHLLQEYFNGCAEKLKKRLNFNPANTQSLRDALKAISDDSFDLLTIQQFVNSADSLNAE